MQLFIVLALGLVASVNAIGLRTTTSTGLDCVQFSSKDCGTCQTSPTCLANNLKKAAAKEKCKSVVGCKWINSDKSCGPAETGGDGAKSSTTEKPTTKPKPTTTTPKPTTTTTVEAAAMATTTTTAKTAAKAKKDLDCVQFSSKDCGTCQTSPTCLANKLKKAAAKEKCTSVVGCKWINSDKACGPE